MDKDNFMKIKEKISHLTTKQKLDYFWEYYKIHAFVVICIILVMIQMVYSSSTKTEDLSHGMFLNSSTTFSSKMISDDYLEYAGIEDPKLSIYVDTSLYLDPDSNDMTTMNSTIKISTLVPAQEVDYMIGPKDLIEHYGSNGFFLSLEEILPDDLYETYSDQILYYNFTEEDNTYLGEHPIAINISDSPKLAEWNAYPSEDVYFAFVSNSLRQEAAIDFLEYLYSTD